MFERKNISAGGVVLSYLASQQGARGTVLFLHGWRSSATVWQNAMEALSAEGFAVYALDLPGFGSSQNPPHAFSVRDYADIVSAFIEKLGIGSVTVVGHSFGGRVGILLSAEKPTLVSKLVLVDSAGVPTPSLARDLIGFFAKITKPVFSLSFMQGVRKKIYIAIGAEDYLATPELVETFKLVINEDLRPFLPKIQQETLLVWGEYDSATPISDALSMEKAIPRSELKILTGAEHFSFLDAPEEFSQVLKSFI